MDRLIILCPFCGNHAEAHHFSTAGLLTSETGLMYYVRCNTMDCSSGPIRCTEDDAIDAWNQRDPEDPDEASRWDTDHHYMKSRENS